jgi:hypothetical protein
MEDVAMVVRRFFPLACALVAGLVVGELIDLFFPHTNPDVTSFPVALAVLFGYWASDRFLAKRS